MINITKYRKFYYLFSGAILVVSVASLFIFGLNLGLDFKGGSILEINYSQTLPSKDRISSELKKIGLLENSLQETAGNNLIIRFKEIDESKHQELKTVLENLGQEIDSHNILSESVFESLGPSIGQELKVKTLYAMIIVFFLIVFYIAYAFRKVSHPLSSWQYGLATLLTLFHDVLIPMGVFALLNHYKNIEINMNFVVAILTILGYSVHDTIIVFDRIRENLLKSKNLNFEEIVNRSLNQTFLRSINTSLTVIFVLLAIYFFGGVSIKYFALALLIGIGAGTYSSIFIASPILVSWYYKKLKYGLR
ncbi:protein translocase subunit SecF [Candidatus Azambacteria bacterium]|nr:protein translocase subunit SecF [Candidatus Azambacteria bacterium]